MRRLRPIHSPSLNLPRQLERLCIQECNLVKLAEGGYHKVYKVSGDLRIVVRVAAPAFPKDKLESEVATLQYIASHSSIHTPHVYAWNTENDNPVGLEYMILEKVFQCGLGHIAIREETGCSS
ncbi:kinase-like protein [Lentinula edodes]|uniref:Altered inheritance of mitochondria protein 9, mitochondrial n=1 Tax=Lentinula edodes TaxID=5353 RepID=A0A1Q3EL41_LENED|nr:kinase-like protein [Lentinula edodes]